MIDKKSFKKAVAAPLEAAHFQKKGQSWYVDGRDAIAVLSLQKSDWADEYFINIGIWMKGLGGPQYFDENDCHLSHRLESLFPGEQKLIRDGASLEHGNTGLLQDLSKFIGVEVVPFLEDCTDEGKLRQFMASGRFRLGFVRKDARLRLAPTDDIADRTK
jgi:hypothetical protein